MNELFKKAAEDYPLKTDSFDWEYLQGKLVLENGKKTFFSVNNYKYPFIILLLLLFIPVHIAITNIRILNTKNNSFTVQNQDTLTVLQSERHRSLANQKNNTLYSNKSSGKVITVLYSPPIRDIVIKTNSKPTGNSVQQNILNYDRNDFLQSYIPIAGNKENEIQNNFVITGTDENNAAINVVKENKTDNNTSDNYIKTKSRKTSGFYIGALIASELTTVKSQPFRKAGYNMGFLAGYKLSNRLYAEIGIALSHKYYYTDGKYAAPNTFRTDEAEVKSVDAFSSVTEIPVTFRYNIKESNSNNFFVAAGAVSSIVHKEKYNYGYTKNGREKSGYKKYNKSLDNIFSNIQLSAGYEHDLTNTGRIRIEPYYRIPVNGIGVSNLPITSIGVNLGLIKRF